MTTKTKVRYPACVLVGNSFYEASETSDYKDIVENGEVITGFQSADYGDIKDLDTENCYQFTLNGKQYILDLDGSTLYEECGKYKVIQKDIELQPI